MGKKQFFLNGYINTTTVQAFKHYIRNQVKNGHTIFYIRFRSYGGEDWSGRLIGNMLYILKKRHPHFTFEMEGEIFQSTAFKLFLRGDIRTCTKNASAAYHLPELRDMQTATPQTREAIERTTIRFLTHHMKNVSEDEIRDRNNTELPIQYLLEKGIVHSVVERF